MKLLVYASGRGSNFVAIAEAIRNGEFRSEKGDAVITGLVCNKSEAPCMERAREFGIPIWQKLTEGEQLERIRAEGIDLIILAGYMKILPKEFIEKMREHVRARAAEREAAGLPKLGVRDSGIVNIHPSLLPAYPGIHSYARAFADGKSFTGITIHWVDEGVDTGEPILQEPFSMERCQSAEDVEKKGLALENALYPRTLKQILFGGSP